MADAVWLIQEDTIYPAFLSQSPIGLTDISAVSRLPAAACPTGNACAEPSKNRRHTMARSEVCQSVLTGYPAADVILYGYSMPAGTEALKLRWRSAAECFRLYRHRVCLTPN